nr:hypothetical protein B0A51_17279 [Rachicladosporium sp. CCFEE 5018]
MAATNGVNGANGHHTNGNGTSTTPVPATSLLADFVATASPTQLTPALRLKVKEVLLDYIGVTVGAHQHAESTVPIYEAILALQGGPVPNAPSACTVLGMGAPHFLPQYAGLMNATLGHSMDFDDTYAPGTLHAGVTAISASLAQAELLGEKASTDLFTLAVAVSYEITCRLGRELGYEAYSRGMHNTSTAGIFGAVAAIAVLRGLSKETIEMAWVLAGSKAAGSMQYLDNGSWNKRLHPGFAVHDAFMCVNLAAAGSQSGQGSLSTDNRPGKDWEFLRSSLKPFSACRMTHAFIEIAGDMHSARSKAGRVKPDDIKEVRLTMSPSNFLLVGDPTPNKIHPTNAIDAQFSAYYQVANALIYGADTGMEAYQKLDNGEIAAVSGKISVSTDSSITAFGARLHITWADGSKEKKDQPFPLGEEQHPYTKDRVEAKFRSLAVPVYGAEKSKWIIDMVDRLEDFTVQELLQELQ